MWSLTRCGAFAPLLWEYAEGKLQDAKEGARVEEHVAGCDRCRAELAAIQEVAGAWASFAGTPAPTAPPRWEAVRERIAAPARTPAPLRRRPVIAPTAIAGAFFAGVLGVAALLLPSRTAPEPTALTGTSYPKASRQTFENPDSGTSASARRGAITLNAEPAFVAASVGAYGRGTCPIR